MLYYDRIDMSDGIDVTKSNHNEESIICHYRLLTTDSNFKFLQAMVVISSYKNTILFKICK